MLKKLTLLSIVALVLLGCSAITGEEIGRLAINKLSQNENYIVKEVTIDLKKGDEIVFWSDMDLSYEGDVKLMFRLKIFKDEAKFKTKDIDPFKKNITIGEMKTGINGKTNWSFTGKNSKLKIEEDATYNIKGILLASKNASLKITKAELVIKK
jgi:hypothetical protein